MATESVVTSSPGNASEMPHVHSVSPEPSGTSTMLELAAEPRPMGIALQEQQSTAGAVPPQQAPPAPPSIKTRKSHNTGNNPIGGMPQLRALRVGSQAHPYGSPFAQHTNAPPESPHIQAGMAYPQYLLYSMPASPMAYPVPVHEPNSPHASPSPLMGSPVGTPTAMMFPQTPFAGAHNPFAHYHTSEGAISPHASGRVSYFHPLFNNFPFMGLQSLASVPNPGNANGGQGNSNRPGSTPSKPGGQPGEGQPGAGGPASDAHANNMANGKGPHQAGLLMGQPSYGLLTMPPHIQAAMDDTEMSGAYMDVAGSMLTGMINTMQLQGYPHQMPMFMPVADPLQMAAAQQAAMAQLSPPQMDSMNSSTGYTSFAEGGAAAGRGGTAPSMNSGYAVMMQPGSPNMGAAGLHAGMGQAGAAWGVGVQHAPAGMGGQGMPGPGFDMWDMNAMYGLSMQALGMQQGMYPDMFGAGGHYRNDASAAAHRKSRFAVNNAGMRMMPPGPGMYAGFPLSMMHMAAAQGLPHISTHVVGSPPMQPQHGRRGGGVSPNTAGQQKARRAGGTPAADAPKVGPDGLPRLNARQRRTLRRAKERAIKGLMEAGRLLLQRATSTSGGPTKDGSMGGGSAAPGSVGSVGPDDGSGSDEDKQEAGSNGSPNMASTTYYFQAAMQVAGGSHGPEAAANASSVLNQVAAELEDMDLADLISQLTSKKETGGVDDSLIRDLQIIQNLVGALRSPSMNNAAGGALTGATSPAQPHTTMSIPPTSTAGVAKAVHSQ